MSSIVRRRLLLRLVMILIGIGSATASAVTALAAGADPAPWETQNPIAQRTVAPSRHTDAGVTPHAGWIGTCYVARGTNWAGGWCDGNGPDWTYRGAVQCTNGIWYLGTSRWAGDRRGSYAECPSGKTATTGGVWVYYNGVWQYWVLV
jgi:hypothetical protein